MCGLFGAKANHVLSKDEKTNVQKLAVYSSFRGWHSMGMSFGSSGKKDMITYRIKKEVTDPWGFIVGKEFNETKDIPGTFLMMGHNRFATVGVITHENAHPYWEGPVIGAHNGTVQALAPAKLIKDGKEVQRTDSYELIKMLSETNIKEVAKKAEWGAFALTWTDRRDSTFNMARNDKRELWVMIDDSQDTMYWASTQHILRHMKAEADTGHKMREPFLLDIHTHYKFPLNSWEFEKEDIKPPVRHYPSVPAAGVEWWHGTFRDGKKPVNGVPKGTQNVTEKPHGNYRNAFLDTIKAKSEVKKDGEIPFDKPAVAALKKRLEDRQKPTDLYATAKYKLIPTVKAVATLKDGCLHCTNSFSILDTTWWPTDDTFVCQKCANLEAVKETIGSEWLYQGMIIKNLDELSHGHDKQRKIRFCM